MYEPLDQPSSPPFLTARWRKGALTMASHLIRRYNMHFPSEPKNATEPRTRLVHVWEVNVAKGFTAL